MSSSHIPSLWREKHLDSACKLKLWSLVIYRSPLFPSSQLERWGWGQMRTAFLLTWNEWASLKEVWIFISNALLQDSSEITQGLDYYYYSRRNTGGYNLAGFSIRTQLKIYVYTIYINIYYDILVFIYVFYTYLLNIY